MLGRTERSVKRIGFQARTTLIHSKRCVNASNSAADVSDKHCSRRFAIVAPAELNAMAAIASAE